jgi:hypothetical protein
MIDVSEVVGDFDMQAPLPYLIQRSTGQWLAGGFQSITTNISNMGPVQPATDEDVQMLPEADRVSGVLAFWSLIPIYQTRDAIEAGTIQTVTMQGDGGTVYYLPKVPGSQSITPSVRLPGVGTGFLFDCQGVLFRNSMFMTPGVDYTITGNVITMMLPLTPDDILTYQYPYFSSTGQSSGPAASDILIYASLQYRVMSTRYYPGGGYWKALGTRLSTV